ncbi:25S rRNA (uridine-N(3))-methyltransferase BMT5-like [Dillenia turbinata]|uniref:25S rRNA (Uridine-N(3))-methyltransferase BMT5-like n=1 Tax=Dillenia turbinata TaxID=194707 RepID=A0AAN8WEZ0_9MAGN
MELDAQEKNERKVELISEKEVALVADEEKNGRTVESASGKENKNHVKLAAEEERKRERNESEVKVAGEEENKRKIKLVTEENQILVTLYTAEEIISKVELSAKNKNESKSELVADVESESKTKWVKHYNSRHKILLVGEGDFSFAACLGRAFGSAANIVATSLDSQELLVIKHRNASANLRSLRELGCTILHEVNALSMRTHPVLSFRSFDRIVFNFPHAGFYGREHDSFQIELHKNLVRGYLQNAHGMVSEKGEIHVTHKTTYPFSCWKIKELAAGCGLKLIEEVRFTKWDYPGYENKRGHGVRSDESFPVGQCSTYKFTKK